MKQWLSEFTDRSEPTVDRTPADIAERLGVPLVGGVQDRNHTESVLVSKPSYLPVGVCATCGRVLFSRMKVECAEASCPVSP